MTKLSLHPSRFGCVLNDVSVSEAEHSYVNIYVRISNSCQANCRFCEFKNIGYDIFDIKKFMECIDLVQKETKINKISFTGGEPTLNIKPLKKCIDYIKNVDESTFIVVNTNGYNLKELLDIKDIDSISLSRHHYRDDLHRKIMGSNKIPSSDFIKNIDTSNVHFTCNLISGYIDNWTDVKKYLEYSADVGVYDVGFVGLMPVNEYCADHHVDFSDIYKNDDKFCIRNKIWKRIQNGVTICQCNNLLYLPKKGENVVAFYYRERCKHKEGSVYDRDLYFDGRNLKSEFYGEILI